MTHYIDDLKPGMSESYARTVSERDVALFGEVSGDMNPVHFDEEFAKKTIFKGRIVHGALTLSFLSTVLGLKMPGPGTVVFNLTIAFKAPVRIGDTVTALVTVRELVGTRRAIFDCVCKVGDMIVAEGEALVMAPARPR
jgi:3-hydroxybutyryl-CoA dehydratase